MPCQAWLSGGRAIILKSLSTLDYDCHYNCTVDVQEVCLRTRVRIREIVRIRERGVRKRTYPRIRTRVRIRGWLRIRERWVHLRSGCVSRGIDGLLGSDGGAL
jgi:hypothetical protein